MMAPISKGSIAARAKQALSQNTVSIPRLSMITPKSRGAITAAIPFANEPMPKALS